MDLSTAMRIAAAGMKAQSSRLRVTAENLANAQSTAQVAGGDPYRRKTIAFGSREDREPGGSGAELSGGPETGSRSHAGHRFPASCNTLSHRV